MTASRRRGLGERVVMLGSGSSGGRDYSALGASTKAQKAQEATLDASGAPGSQKPTTDGSGVFGGSQGRQRTKYGNVVTHVDGKRFASKREAARYQALVVAERAGVIRFLECQVIYRFEINGVKIGRYTADFRYVIDGKYGPETVVEDAKGYRPRDWSRTKSLMAALHGVKVQEV